MGCSLAAALHEPVAVCGTHESSWGDEREMNTSYAGAALERSIVEKLRSLKWPLVTRTPASKGVFDVIAKSSSRCLLVQAKRSPSCSPAERRALSRLAMDVDAEPVLVLQPKGKPANWYFLDHDGNRPESPAFERELLP
jgi:Holliday junction resolvase